MPERLLLIRHGESTWNAEERWQGWADCPLSPLGMKQAREAAASLLDAPLSGVACSDLARAHQTAEIIAGHLGLEVDRVDPGLREYDVGTWEGLTRDEIESGWPGVRAAWREGRLAALPGGETRDAFGARVLAAVKRLAARDELGPSVLVVTHGGVVRLIERHLGLDTEPVPNLCGRWVSLSGDGAELAAGERVELVAPAHQTPSPTP